jgi:hypothetical protein
VGSREYGLGDNIKTDLKEFNGEVWAGFIWFRTGTSGGLLWSR